MLTASLYESAEDDALEDAIGVTAVTINPPTRRTAAGKDLRMKPLKPLIDTSKFSQRCNGEGRDAIERIND